MTQTVDSGRSSTSTRCPDSSSPRSRRQIFAGSDSSGIRNVWRVIEGCWNQPSFNVRPVHPARPTAATDAMLSPSEGAPSTACTRFSSAAIARFVASPFASTLPARNTGYARRISNANRSAFSRNIGFAEAFSFS